MTKIKLKGVAIPPKMKHDLDQRSLSKRQGSRQSNFREEFNFRAYRGQSGRTEETLKDMIMKGMKGGFLPKGFGGKGWFEKDGDGAI